MRKIFCLLILGLTFSCKEKDSNVLRNTTVVTTEDSTSIDTIQTIKLLEKEIDVKEIKDQLDGVITGFLSKEETIFYIDRVKNNFYGHYELIKKMIKEYLQDEWGNL